MFYSDVIFIIGICWHNDEKYCFIQMIMNLPKLFQQRKKKLKLITFTDVKLLLYLCLL